MKTTALIILNYNNFEDTINCIESVEKHNTAPVKIIVVDNGSSGDGVVRSLDNFMSSRYGGNYSLLNDDTSVTPGVLKHATLLVSDTNDGYARGNNKAMRLVEGDDEIDNIMILNNDILFVEDIIPRLLSARETLNDCAIISPLLLCRDGKRIDINCARKAVSVNALTAKNFLKYLRRLARRAYDADKRYILKFDDAINGTMPAHGMIPIELPSGSCMLLSKKLFREIGWFDPGTFLYFEEDILYQKIASRGLANYLDTSCRCIHLGAESTRRNPAPAMMRISLDSERYYVDRFSGAGTLSRLAHSLSVKVYWLLYQIQQRLKSRQVLH